MVRSDDPSTGILERGVPPDVLAAAGRS